VEHNSEFGAAKDQVLHLSQQRVLQARLFGQSSKWVPELRLNLNMAGYTVKPSMAIKLVGIW
jgi:carbamoylphosphate synthase small subunit